MPPRDWAFRVTDVLRAVEAVRYYVDGMDVDAFAKDQRTVDAVVRNLIIIGEVATHMPSAIVRAHPEIPWSDMSAMRNFVVHEYFGVSNRVIWDTVQEDLPSLVAPLQALLHSEEK